jgi:hypothetical protein
MTYRKDLTEDQYQDDCKATYGNPPVMPEKPYHPKSIRPFGCIPGRYTVGPN